MSGDLLLIDQLYRGTFDKGTETRTYAARCRKHGASCWMTA